MKRTLPLALSAVSVLLAIALIVVSILYAVSAPKTEATFTPAVVLSNEVKAQNEYYVDPVSGRNGNPGTKERPFKSLDYAFKAVETFKDQTTGDMSVVLNDGTYYLEDTLTLGPNVDLADGRTFILKAADNAEPVLSGGIKVTDWESVQLNGKEVLKASVPQLDSARSLWVNDVPAQLAFDDGDETHAVPLTNEDGAANMEASGYEWDFYPQIEVNDYSALASVQGITVKGKNLRELKNPSQLEIYTHRLWKNFIFCAEYVAGENNAVMDQGAFNYVMTAMANDIQASAHNVSWYPLPTGWRTGGTHYNERVILYNDVSFIDHPGEFCFDEQEKAVYYYPREGETAENMQAYLPRLEQTVSIGNGLSGGMLNDFAVDGITFSHGAQSVIRKDGGFGTSQANVYYGATGQETESAHMYIGRAQNVRITDCNFVNNEGAAITVWDATDTISIEKCNFENLGSSAIILGNPVSANNTQDYTQNIKILDNTITKIGLWQHSAPAITTFYTRDVEIGYNEISDVPYAGISTGWGWYFNYASTYNKNTSIHHNKIGRFAMVLSDTAGIYTLGQNVDSEIMYNYIYEQYEEYGGIYHDEGSCGWTTVYNLIDNLSGSAQDGRIAPFHINANIAPEGTPRAGKPTTYNIAVNFNYYVTGGRGSAFGADSSCSTNINAEYGTAGANTYGGEFSVAIENFNKGINADEVASLAVLPQGWSENVVTGLKAVLPKEIIAAAGVRD